MGGQIVDATIVAAPKQRNTEAARAATKAGQIPEGWAEKPSKLRQKDRDARWMVGFSRAKPRINRRRRSFSPFRPWAKRTTWRATAGMG
jgi:hypothetical protein